jgi:hypothetical protein
VDCQITLSNIVKIKMKRFEVHSHKPRVNVYLTSVNLDKHKRYKLAVEKLSVPAIESRILNTPLFEVMRRIRVMAVPFNDGLLDLDVHFAKFTPQNVRSLSHLASQVNQFFREFQLRITVAAMPVFNAARHEYNRVGTQFAQELAADWYTLNKETQVSVIVRSDGRLGFKFTPDFQKFFVLKFTEEGRRIFGFKDFLAIDNNGEWDSDYIQNDEPAYDLPPEADLQTEMVFTESVFPFVDHRSELVVQMSLPLSTTGEGTKHGGFYKRQLASYRFPEYETAMEVGLSNNTLMRSISEVRQHTFEFEKGATHNKFILTGTDLQNFNVLLTHRVHTWKTDRFVQTETDYEMPPESTFILRFSVRPVQ